MRKESGRSTKAGVSRELFMERPSCELFWDHDGEFVNENRWSRELFEMDAHLQECNHASSDRWRSEPLYAVRHRRYLADTVPQPGVGQITRNVGHGQHANGSREAPGGNEGRCGSTLRWINGAEFNDGKKMATDGNGLDEDWTMVLEMCEREICGSGQLPLHGQHYKPLSRRTLNDGSCQLSLHGQHDQLLSRRTLNDGSCQLSLHGHHDKHLSRWTLNSRMPHAPRYLRDYPKVTLLGGPLSRTHLHRGNRVLEFDDGSCQLLPHERHYKLFNATDLDPGDTKVKPNVSNDCDMVNGELARRYAQHGLKDPEGCVDSADEEVQTILGQSQKGQRADEVRDVGTVRLNVFEQSSDSESIEVLSGREDTEDEEFLGYYTVGPDGKRRPIPAPRRMIRMPAVGETEDGASSVVTQSSSPAVRTVESKTGKEVVFAEVRRHRISLSNDSQGRVMPLIPPGYDGHSMLSTLNTLPQYQSIEEAWHQAGPEFQQGQTRFRTYNNDFDAGVVLPEYVGPRPLGAPMHATTNTKPPDIRVDDYDAVPPRWIMPGTAGFFPYQFRKTRHGRKLEKELGPGIVAPPRRASLLGNNPADNEGKARVDDVEPLVEGMRSPGLLEYTSGNENELDSSPLFPSTGVGKDSEPPDSHLFIGSTKSGCDSRTEFPSTGTDVISHHQKSPYFIGSTETENDSLRLFPSNECAGVSQPRIHHKLTYLKT